MIDNKIEAVLAIVAEVLNMSSDELGPDSSMENTPIWDSMEHMNICLLFERRFGATLDIDAISTATSVRGLASLVP